MTDAVALGGQPRARAGGRIAALVGAACYGLNIPIAKIATDMGVEGAALIVVRAGLCITGFCLAGLIWRWRPALAKGDATNVGLVSLFAAGCAVGYLGAVTRLPVSVAVIVFYTFPLWIILYTVARQGRSAAFRLVAFALAFAGILVVVGLDIGRFSLSGLLMALVASICTAALFIVGAKVRTDKITVLFYLQGPSFAAALIFMLLAGNAPPAALLAAAALPIVLSGIGYYLGFFFQLVAAGRMNAAAAGLLFLFEPVVAITVSVLLLGEAMTPSKLAGIALVLSGLALDVMLEQRRIRRIGA